MRLENMVGERFKEKPSDCVVDSHALMIRGGYMKYVANGIYSMLPPLKRITSKIEQIIREEMNALDGQEVLFPVVLPASLWEESGRYESVGSELLRLKDRNNSSLVLGMTHEEAAVHLVREYAQSYTKYPFMIYQIQTKFRDEARPRAGLIRVREFTMKDAYSFHTEQSDLEAYYLRCLKAYERIFARVGIPEVISVASDSGMMGGKLSHEFMLLTPVGEDSIAICKDCDYHANVEAAEVIVEADKEKNPSRAGDEKTEGSQERKLLYTPNAHTIEELCEFVKCDKADTCKAVVYQRNSDDKFVVLFIRGDFEVNETKVRNYIKDEIHPANITAESGLKDGFIGPCDLQGDCIVLFDRSLEHMDNLVCGANQYDYHYTGMNLLRDVGEVEFGDFAKIKEGGICPKCGKHSITISRGIEVGNIFQLGDKYTKAMKMTYTDKEGNLQYPVMGCYGIGIGRLAAAICEAHHDEFGPIWPLAVAPWQVHICGIRTDDERVNRCANDLYQALQKAGIEVLFDGRTVGAGVKFSDADLLGIPFRMMVSPRNLEKGVVEILSRDKKVQLQVSVETAVETMKQLIADAIKD